MSNYFDDISNYKSNINIYNIEPNSLINLSFNFDILKYVITEMIKNQKNINNEISNIKSEILQNKKDTNKLQFSLLELRLATESNLDVKKNLEDEKTKLNKKLNELEEQIKISENNRLAEVKNTINEMINKEKLFNTQNNVNNDNNIKINNDIKEKPINNDNNITLSKKEKSYNETKVIKVQNNEIGEEIKTIINDIKDIKSKQLFLEKDFIQYKNDIEKNISKKIEKYIPDLEDNLSSKIKLSENVLNEKIKKNINNINLIKEEHEQKNKEISQKLDEFEKSKKDISNLKQENETFSQKINTLTNNFSNYTQLSEFNKNKDDTYEYIKGIKEDINKNVELLRRGFNNIKNQFLEHIKDKTDHDNLDLMLKRFEIMQNMIYKFKEFQTIMEEKEKKRALIDPNSFIDKEVFNEFINNHDKFYEDYKNESLAFKKDLEELKRKEVGNKATLKDLKSLEDNILKKLDDLKKSITRKYVDKNTMNKNRKILEMQTIQLIQENKKDEQKDTWLLSKKPFGGHLCASCESYIGELNPTTSERFIPWNKYPPKESKEKTYKIEGGISQVLNRFNNTNQLNNNINSASLNNSSNNEDSRQNSRNSVKENSLNKIIQVNSFTSRLNPKLFSKIKSNFDEMENIYNLPLIPKSIKNMRKNYSSIDMFNSENMNNKKIKNAINNFKSNKSSFNFNKKNNIKLSKRNIQIEDDEFLYDNFKKNNTKIKENDSEKEEPKIMKIIKKH